MIDLLEKNSLNDGYAENPDPALGIISDTKNHTFKEALGRVLYGKDNVEIIDGRLFICSGDYQYNYVAATTLQLAIIDHISNKFLNRTICPHSVPLYVNELEDNPRDFFLPDLMVIESDKEIGFEGVHCVPIFVAEIVNEKSRELDLGRKKDVYLSIGVEEYMIVDLQERQVISLHKVNDYKPQLYHDLSSIPIESMGGIKVDFSKSLFMVDSDEFKNKIILRGTSDLDKYNLCKECFSDNRIETFTSETIEWDEKTILIKSIPCYKCRKCGNLFYSDDVSKNLENITNSIKRLNLELAILDYKKAFQA